MEHDAFLPRYTEYQAQGQVYSQGGYGAYSASEDIQETIGAKQGYQPLQYQSHQPHSSSQQIHPQAPVGNMAYNYAISEERQDQRTDPYRSAYSQQQNLQHGAPSLNHESPGAPFDETNQATFSSRHSINSSNGVNAAGQRYPMHTLQSKNSSQALSPSFHQHQNTGLTPASSVFGGQSDRYQDNADGSVIGLTTRQSYAVHDQSKLNTEEDENAEILRKVSQSGTRSGVTQGSLSSSLGRKRLTGGKWRKRGRASSEDSEEEGQERGEMRQRDSKRCWSPAFSFQSVASMGDPVETSNQIQEPFSLQLQVDSSDNYLPIKLNSIEMTVWMKIDQTNIGNNDNLLSSFVIHPKTVQVISIPMVLDYTSLTVNTNADGTFQELVTACKPVDSNSGTLVPGINLTFGGKMNVWGLSWIWKPQFSFSVDSVPCPVNARNSTTVTLPTPIAAQPSSTSGGATASQTVSGTPSATKSSGTLSQTTTGGTSSSSSLPTPTA
ncbi:hypothetical protein BGZ58_002555 [Dissophora ornata]|nr:hypothetical protein BGZ58_002555 [Dissophora ornata]